METARKTWYGDAGVGLPLVASAAGHLALIAGLLLFGAAAGPELFEAVQVVLVEGPAAQETIATGRISVSSQGALRHSGVRPRAVRGPIEEEAYAVRMDEPNTGTPEHIPAPAAVPSPPPATAAVPGDSGGAAVSSVMTPGGSIDGIAGAGMPSRAGSAGGYAMPSAPQAPAYAGVKGTGGDGMEVRRLRERIESRIVYPEEAIRRGQEGEVLLRIRVGEGGIPKEIRVARSSGARILDEAARTGVFRAAPLPSIPGWFEVPVRFFLR
jgi:TonB family protein